MGIISRILGSGNVIENGMKAADAVVFTKEERSEWHLRLLKAYEPFRLAQRYLALLLTITFVSVHIIASLMLFASGFALGELGKSLQGTALFMFEKNHETLWVPVSAVLGFYFGGGLVEGGIRVFKDKTK